MMEALNLDITSTWVSIPWHHGDQFCKAVERDYKLSFKGIKKEVPMECEVCVEVQEGGVTPSMHPKEEVKAGVLIKNMEITGDAVHGCGDAGIRDEMDNTLYAGIGTVMKDEKGDASLKNPFSRFGSCKPAFVPAAVHRNLKRKVEKHDVKLQIGHGTLLLCSATQTEGPCYLDASTLASVEVADKATHTSNNPQFTSSVKARPLLKRVTHRGMQAVVGTQDRACEAKLSLIAPPECPPARGSPLDPRPRSLMGMALRCPLNMFGNFHSQATQTVETEMISQSTSVSARHLGYVCDKLVQAGRGFGDTLCQQATQTDGTMTTRKSSGIIGPVMYYHSATQTEGSGTTHFHKATQWPDVLYSMDQVREATATSEPTSIKFYTPPESTYNTATCPPGYPTVTMYTAPTMSTVYQETVSPMMPPSIDNSKRNFVQPESSQVVISSSASLPETDVSPNISSALSSSSEFVGSYSMFEMPPGVSYSTPTDTTTTVSDSSSQAAESMMASVSASASGLMVSAGMPCPTYPTFSPQMSLAPSLESSATPLIYMPPPPPAGTPYQPVYMPPYGAAPLPYAPNPPQYYWLWK